MNIYYSDEEMRKQAASLLGKLVVTGQESAQGSRKGMREDVYKKHMSADKLPERMPYAIDTHYWWNSGVGSGSSSTRCQGRLSLSA